MSVSSLIKRCQLYKLLLVYVNIDDYQEIAQLDSGAFLLQSDTTNYQTQEFTYWVVIQIWNTEEKPVLKVSGKMALEDVNSGMMTVRRAVLKYNVPKSTLHNRWVKPSAKLEPFHYLDDGEEDNNCPLDNWMCRNEICKECE